MCVFQGPICSSEAVIRGGCELRPRLPRPQEGPQSRGPLNHIGTEIVSAGVPGEDLENASSRSGPGTPGGEGSGAPATYAHVFNTEGLSVLPRAFRDGQVPTTWCLADHPDAAYCPDLLEISQVPLQCLGLARAGSAVEWGAPACSQTQMTWTPLSPLSYFPTLYPTRGVDQMPQEALGRKPVRSFQSRIAGCDSREQPGEQVTPDQRGISSV